MAIRKAEPTEKDNVFALLYSHAIAGQVTLDWVSPGRFYMSVHAARVGEMMRERFGVEYEIMIRYPDGVFRNVRGETAIEVIARRWGRSRWIESTIKAVAESPIIDADAKQLAFDDLENTVGNDITSHIEAVLHEVASA